MKQLLLLGSLLCLSGVSYAQNVEEQKIAPPRRLIFSLPEEDTKTLRNYEMLTATVDKPVVNGSEAVMLKFSIKNTTDKILNWGPSARSIFKDYQIRVKKVLKDKEGKETLTIAPLTEYGKAAISIFTRRGWYTSLKAGEATPEHSLAINRFFDMTMPGTYSVTVHLHANLGGSIDNYISSGKNELILLASQPIRVEVK